MKTKNRFESMQTKLELCGKYGCLFLCILSIAEEVSEKEIDLQHAILICQSKGWLSYDFTVKDSLAILNYYTNKTWHRLELTKLPSVIKDNEYTVVKYYNSKTKYTHFKRRSFDTLVDSQTVKFGFIQEYYIYNYEV